MTQEHVIILRIIHTYALPSYQAQVCATQVNYLHRLVLSITSMVVQLETSDSTTSFHTVLGFPLQKSRCGLASACRCDLLADCEACSCQCVWAYCGLLAFCACFFMSCFMETPGFDGSRGAFVAALLQTSHKQSHQSVQYCIGNKVDSLYAGESAGQHMQYLAVPSFVTLDCFVDLSCRFGNLRRIARPGTDRMYRIAATNSAPASRLVL